MRTDEEIRHEVARLMVEGLGYREICDRLEIEPSAVGRHKRALQRAATEALNDDAQAVRLVEDLRLEALVAAYWPMALAQDYKAADLVLRAHQAKVKLWGLDSISGDEKPDEFRARLLAKLLKD